jgi:hypothetical protein
MKCEITNYAFDRILPFQMLIQLVLLPYNIFLSNGFIERTTAKKIYIEQYSTLILMYACRRRHFKVKRQQSFIIFESFHNFYVCLIFSKSCAVDARLREVKSLSLCEHTQNGNSKVVSSEFQRRCGHAHRRRPKRPEKTTRNKIAKYD